MADAAKESERRKLERKRELRRRKVLQNSSERLEKLRNAGKSSTACTAADDASQESRDAVPVSLLGEDSLHSSILSPVANSGSDLSPDREPDPPSSPDPPYSPDPSLPSEQHSVPDPPDELVETRPPPPPPPSPPHRSLPAASALSLSLLVSSVQTPRWLRLRSLLSAVVGVACVLIGWRTTLMPSAVSSVVLADSFLLALLLLSFSLQPSPPPPSPLGRLSLVKLALLYVSPTLATLFEMLCLAAYLVGVVLRDIVTGLFCCVVTAAVVSLFTPPTPLHLH